MNKFSIKVFKLFFSIFKYFGIFNSFSHDHPTKNCTLKDITGVFNPKLNIKMKLEKILKKNRSITTKYLKIVRI